MMSKLRETRNALEGRLIHLTTHCPNGVTLAEKYRQHTRFFRLRRNHQQSPPNSKSPGVFMIQLQLHPGRGTRKALACISEPLSEVLLDPEDGDIPNGELVCSILNCVPLRDLEAGRLGHSLNERHSPPSLGSSVSTTNHKRLALDMLHLRMWFKTITDKPRNKRRSRPVTGTPQSPSESRQQPQAPPESSQQSQQPDSGDSSPGSTGSSKSEDSGPEDVLKLRLTRRGLTDAEKVQVEVHRVTQAAQVIKDPVPVEKRTLPMSMYLSSIENRTKPVRATVPKPRPVRIQKRGPPAPVKRIATTYQEKRRKRKTKKMTWPKRPENNSTKPDKKIWEPTFIYHGPHCTPHVSRQWDHNLNNYYGLPHGKRGEKPAPPPKLPPRAPRAVPKRQRKTFCLNDVTPRFEPATPTLHAALTCDAPRTSYCLDDVVPLFQPVTPAASETQFACPPGRSGRVFDACTGMPEANEARDRRKERKARRGTFDFPAGDEEVKPAAPKKAEFEIVSHKDSASPRWDISELWRSPKPVMHKSSLSASPKFDGSLGTPPRPAGKRTPSPTRDTCSQKTPPRKHSSGSPQVGEALATLASLLKTQFTSPTSDEKSTRLNAYNELEKLSLVSFERCPDVPEVPLTCDLDRSTGAILLPYKENRGTTIYKKFQFPKAPPRAGVRC